MTTCVLRFSFVVSKKEEAWLYMFNFHHNKKTMRLKFPTIDSYPRFSILKNADP